MFVFNCIEYRKNSCKIKDFFLVTYYLSVRVTLRVNASIHGATDKILLAIRFYRYPSIEFFANTVIGYYWSLICSLLQIFFNDFMTFFDGLHGFLSKIPTCRLYRANTRVRLTPIIYCSFVIFNFFDTRRSGTCNVVSVTHYTAIFYRTSRTFAY